MSFLLASLLFLAVGEAPPLPVLTDAEVVSQLRPTELAEWHSSMRVATLGQTRLNQGQSIMKTSLAAANASKLGKAGGLTESPEQIKARAQKIINEGNAQIQQALPSLNRLRLVAAQRVADQTKAVDFPLTVPPLTLAAAVTDSVGRLQKQAAATGFQKIHLIGALALSAEGSLDRPVALTAQLRAAWDKASPGSLVTVPAEGYAYVPPSTVGAAAAISKSLAPVTAAGQEAVVWAEAYVLKPDGSQGLFFLRLADAHTLRLLASEVAFVDLRSGAAPTNACAIVLRDQRSFLARLTASGEWLFGFAGGSHPVGSAILAHLSVTQSKLGVTATPYVVIVAGGGPAPAEAVGAKWRASARPPLNGELAYDVASVPANGPAVEVGRLSIKFPPPGAK